MSILFYSNPICPFAHRVWLALLETGTAHEFKHVALDHIPAWYTPIYKSALGADPSNDEGAVPVIQDGDFLLAESAVIAKYVIAKSDGSKIVKPTPEEEARISIFTEQHGGNVRHSCLFCCIYHSAMF
jgi:glutathione S-transferase